MTRILLDTHILLWWMQGSAKLSLRSRKLIADPGNVIFVSAASIWEMRIKHGLGKLDLPANFGDALAQLAFEELTVSIAHTNELSRLPKLHQDPFDRILISQARVEKLVLLSADKAVVEYGAPVIQG
jgi:PIN domain nuclease of toxin-antitoxin system